MAKKVEIKVGADGAGFHHVMTGVEHRLKHLSGFSEGLKGSLAGAFGGATIALAAESMIEFSERTLKGAEALNITTDNFQALTIMAREAGQSVEIFERSFPKLAKAASNALAGSSKEMSAFAKLGLSNADLTLDKVARLQKIMKGAGALDRGQAEAALRGLGIRDPSRLLAMQSQLSNLSGFTAQKKASGAIASTSDLIALTEVKEKWHSIIDMLRTTLLPVMVLVISVLKTFVRGWRDMLEYLSVTLKAKWGTKLSTGSTLLTVQNNRNFQEDREEKKRIDAEVARLKRESTHTDAAPAITKHSGLGKMEASNPYLKIGGLYGTDMSYRLERLQQQANSFLERIADGVEKMNEDNDDGTGDTGMYRG